MEFFGYLQCPDGGTQSDLRTGPVGEGLSGNPGLPGACGQGTPGREEDEREVGGLFFTGLMYFER